MGSRHQMFFNEHQHTPSLMLPGCSQAKWASVWQVKNRCRNYWVTLSCQAIGINRSISEKVRHTALCKWQDQQRKVALWARATKNGRTNESRKNLGSGGRGTNYRRHKLTPKKKCGRTIKTSHCQLGEKVFVRREKNWFFVEYCSCACFLAGRTLAAVVIFLHYRKFVANYFHQWAMIILIGWAIMEQLKRFNFFASWHKRAPSCQQLSCWNGRLFHERIDLWRA